jgi:sulfite reductase alpha subunit
MILSIPVNKKIMEVNFMSDTPLLDDLEKGKWPSFVTEIKRSAKKNAAAKDLLGIVELSYKEKITHWKHGGIVGVTGYGGGVIGRYTDVPEKFPNAEQFHTVRVNHTSGWFYKTDSLRKICDLWEKYGSGLTNFHGSTGDIILLGTKTENIQKFFDELSEIGFDLGGSGSVLRTPTGCVGPARCEWACFDSLDLVYDLTQTFQDQLHRPRWPYKFKIKASACPNDCVAAIARADFTIIGTWKDSIKIDQKAIKEYAAKGFDIKTNVADRCPGGALTYDDKAQELNVKPEDCMRCMHCLNKMTKAIKIGTVRGASILIGGKAPIQKGAFLSWMLVPYVKVEPPYTEIKELLEKIWDWWDEHGRNRERVAETINRMGFKEFLKAMDMKPLPQMVKYPRSNPFIFY